MRPLLPLAVSLVFSLAAAAAPPTLTPETAQTLHSLLQPQPDETAWLEIPWQVDLAAARAQASEAGKPIYLWEMDGHPLGCT